MEPSTDHINFFIETLRRNNKSGTEIHQLLTSAWGEDVMTLRRVQQIVHDFKEKQKTCFSRSEGSGRPRSTERVNLKTNIEDDLISDPHVSIRQLPAKYGVSNSLVHSIITSDLLYRSLADC